MRLRTKWQVILGIPRSLTASVWDSLVPREISIIFIPVNAITKVGRRQSSVLPEKITALHKGKLNKTFQKL